MLPRYVPAARYVHGCCLQAQQSPYLPSKARSLLSSSLLGRSWSSSRARDSGSAPPDCRLSLPRTYVGTHHILPSLERYDGLSTSRQCDQGPCCRQNARPGMLGEMLFRGPCLQMSMAFPSAAGFPVASQRRVSRHPSLVTQKASWVETRVGSGRFPAHVPPGTGRDPVASRSTVAFHSSPVQLPAGGFRAT